MNERNTHERQRKHAPAVEACLGSRKSFDATAPQEGFPAVILS